MTANIRNDSVFQAKLYRISSQGIGKTFACIAAFNLHIFKLKDKIIETFAQNDMFNSAIIFTFNAKLQEDLAKTKALALIFILDWLSDDPRISDTVSTS